MPRKMSQFLSLGADERWLLLQALLLLLLTAMALRLLSLRRLSATLARFTSASPGPVRDGAQVFAQAQTTKRMINLAARYGPIHATCLHRSLVLWWLLRRQGMACDLRIGVRKAAGQFQAHAWVEYQGDPLNASRAVHQPFRAFDQDIMPALGEWK